MVVLPVPSHPCLDSSLRWNDELGKRPAWSGAKPLASRSLRPRYISLCLVWNVDGQFGQAGQGGWWLSRGERLGGDALYQPAELFVYLVHVGELGEGPAAVLAEVVNAGDPVGLHGGLLLLGVLCTVALDLDDQVEEVVVAASVVDQEDEVWQVGFCGVEPYWYGTSRPRLWFFT